MAAPDEEFWVDNGSPFALALTAARAAFERRDLTEMDEQYRRAVQLARSESATLRTAIAAEHISRLRVLNDSTRALARCEEYLASGGEDVQLRLLRVETELSRGDYSRIDAELTAIRQLAGGRPPRPADDALLNRLEGRAASRHGKWSLAEQHLRRAKDGFAAFGNTAAVTVIDDDLRDLAARRGDAVSDQSPSAADRSPQVRLTRSEELRLAGCYEQALIELDPALEGSLDRAMTFFFLEAKIRLLRLLRNDDQADNLMPALDEAAHASAQPAENLAAARRLASDGAIGPSALVAPGRRLQHVRRLVQDGQLADAERLLLAEPAPPEPDDRHAAEWHLAAAELTLAIADRARTRALARKTLGHLRECLRYANADTLSAIRIIAQRLLGDAHALLDEMDEAAEAWASAHRLEERVAVLQPSDHNRVRMLRSAPDEFDERIRVAARAIERDKLWTPTVVVGMEAARGAAILPRILPGREPLVRELPSPSDIAGARRWIRRTVRGLPRSQIIWMLHATPDHVHHAFIQRTLRHVHVYHASVPCARDMLIKSIDALTRYWQTGDTLETALLSRDFDLQLLDVAKQLGFEANLLKLPERFERIAMVAGGELSEIPFALLPCPGEQASELLSTLQPCLADSTLIGRRYALSDLPCLSVLRPLRRRSHGQRGTRGEQMLLLQPNAAHNPISGGARLAVAERVSGRTVLNQDQATPAALGEALASGNFRHVRIDSHGEFERSPAQEPVIRLAPAGDEGEMAPADLESMSLGATGTLVLGACETGMAKRIGRDERTGFVRAALLSGASAALAARWKALDPVAARVLDRFERNLPHHPRDVALFLAQREEDARDRSGDPSPEQYPATKTHPARWAAWTLYGDTGYQTRRGPLLRWLLRPRNAAVPISISEPTPGEQR